MSQDTRTARAIELYYWSRESDLCQIMRAVIAMTPPARAALRGFLTMSGKPDRIDASFDESGRLTLASDKISSTLKTTSQTHRVRRTSTRRAH